MGIRDHSGTLVHGQAIWYEQSANALTMEAWAIRDGVQLAGDLGFTNVVVESDAQQLVRMWEEMTFDRSEVAPILNEVRALADNFNVFKLAFVHREANELAHLCAKQAEFD